MWVSSINGDIVLLELEAVCHYSPIVIGTYAAEKNCIQNERARFDAYHL